MEKILLFNTSVTDSDNIKRLVMPMHIQIGLVTPTMYDNSLRELVDIKLNNKASSTETPDKFPAESLMLFCNIPDKKMDKILFKLRQNKISIYYKAILTPTNSAWNVRRLYLELERERLAFISQKDVPERHL